MSQRQTSLSFNYTLVKRCAFCSNHRHRRLQRRIHALQSAIPNGSAWTSQEVSLGTGVAVLHKCVVFARAAI